MKKYSILLSVLLFIMCKPLEKHEKVKLVVVISIDQMKSEYLSRFNPQLEAGFKYLLDSAIVYTNAHHNHATTTTAAGHATLATGFFPSHNGITDNTVYNRTLGYKHYSIEDTTVRFVGIEECNLNRVSAKPLLKNALGDYIKESDNESKSYSVALKDRASILMGGKTANRAFWFDAASTQMVSTDYYEETYPNWAKMYTANDVMQADISRGWVLDQSFSTIASISSDSFERERGNFNPWFPHTLASFDTMRVTDSKAGAFMWNSPYGDAFVLEFAQQLIINQNLGTDDHIDVLSIGLSAADVIGHHFGPNSYEVLDYYNKMDFYLAEFIEKLNHDVGKDNYILVLTADHGVAAMPEYLAGQGIDAKRILGDQFDADMAEINTKLQDAFSLTDDIILKANYGGVEPNMTIFEKGNTDLNIVINTLTNELEKLDYIAGAYSLLDINDTTCIKPFITQIRNSHRDEFGYYIKLVPTENYLIDMRRNGTTHGTPHAYDTHVPLIVKLPKQEGQIIEKKAYTVDIVPTVLDLIGIQVKENFDGTNLAPSF
ncbi:alkaline phosphatase family protein [Bacteroidia bacterium]|nr:alkaline phosphatase family protein [Bacteroidia bacterium]